MHHIDVMLCTVLSCRITRWQDTAANTIERSYCLFIVLLILNFFPSPLQTVKQLVYLEKSNHSPKNVSRKRFTTLHLFFCIHSKVPLSEIIVAKIWKRIYLQSKILLVSIETSIPTIAVLISLIIKLNSWSMHPRIM